MSAALVSTWLSDQESSAGDGPKKSGLRLIQGNTKGGCYLPFGRERQKEMGVGVQQENKCRRQCLGQGGWGGGLWWLQFLLEDHLDKAACSAPRLFLEHLTINILAQLATVW